MSVARGARFAESVRSQPGLVGAFLIDAVGTGMFIPFSLLLFLATTSLPLTRIGLGLSIAALVRIPVTIAAGPLCDRFGPRAAIVGSQLLQAAGFAGYLFVHGFWYLVAAAVLVQVGNSVFWVAYAPLIFAVAADGEREHWFALGTALRTAGWAAGGVIAGATVAVGGRDGYIGVAAANGASFLTESATPLAVGLYTSAYQLTFSLADIICPAVVTVELHAGAGALWLPLAAVALLDMAAVGLLARRMPALTRRVGQAPPDAAGPPGSSGASGHRPPRSAPRGRRPRSRGGAAGHQ